MIPRGWIDLVRSLGEALLEVLRAEADLIGRELGDTGRQAGIGAAFMAAAGMVLFWFLGVLTLFLVFLLALWMPTWAAAGTVAGILLILCGALVGLGWLRWKRLENPAETVRRHWQDHQAWWQGRLLAEAEASLPEAEEPPPKEIE